METRKKNTVPPATPMMAQFAEIKSQHPDALLAFRVGDFYEFYGEDAETAAPILNIVLTSRAIRNKKIPMCGVPHHAIGAYLKKLVDAGKRVALCDQVEDTSKAKKLVRRAVVRVVTAGTLIEEDWLEADRHNYLAALVPPSGRRKLAGLAWADVSTGAFHAVDIPLEAAADELARLKPAELLLPMPASNAPALPGELLSAASNLREEDPAVFLNNTAEAAIRERFDTGVLDGLGLESGSPAVRAAGGLLSYLLRTHGSGLRHLSPPTPPPMREFLHIDAAALSHLEILHSLATGTKRGSLLGVVDRTKSAAGARLLREWLTRPLLDIIAIDTRLDAVSFLLRDEDRREELRELIGALPDLERLLARTASGRATPKDLAALRDAFRLFPEFHRILESVPDPLINRLLDSITPPHPLADKLEAKLVSDPPVDIEKGDVFRTGVDPELDRLREARSGGKAWLMELERTEQKATGITSLKVRYNKVFGYYIEITNAHLDKAPPHYIRKQTLANAERFITPRLKEIEDDLVNAAGQIAVIETRMFNELVGEVLASADAIKKTSAVIAELDCLASFSAVAQRWGWKRPQLVEEPLLVLSECRHPVLEAAMPAGAFVPNDIEMHPGAGRILLITGPNMAGKSTYIRQAALAVILAQAGSFVPASRAEVGITDRIFTRIGAGENLVAGRSTFMVEMTEAARILHNATSRSLVILDEIGRGTSTYDGLSLAWAIAEYLHETPTKKARTLFATHYHELTELADTCAEVVNYNVAVKEWNGQLRFLHRIRPGPADKSYGIGVARLAGLPRSVIDRAGEILDKLETVDTAGQFRERMRGVMRGDADMPLFNRTLPSPLLEELAILDPDDFSPRQALEKLAEHVERAKKEMEGK